VPRNFAIATVPKSCTGVACTSSIDTIASYGKPFDAKRVLTPGTKNVVKSVLKDVQFISRVVLRGVTLDW